ncbi:YD repeat-containing protein [Flagellimonas taeanensis]|uniref:YD repeat-containing protein n=2 Tax=Flagellimonas taeanensis TaxID=1005926 RepID=A0A1M7CWZ5_9FLAO|nr:RHS repeat domain-containing protein [Allomuricauda taeanensis]SFC66294.1 YD repeat-containing protein [Allomuricauda taeanensis]SHL71751.1 YD repeat-containing protein [Allomuricauda taeanensis]
MKNLKLFIVLILMANQLSAQLGNEFQSVIPNSPTAEEFKRQVDFPVSYYTGVPDIDINLYSTSVDGKDIDVTLRYLANGIKVDQRATWVGLGWSLNVGGVITRSIRGGADEVNQNFNGYSTNNGPGSKLETFLDLDIQNRSGMTTSEIEFTENYRRHGASGQYDTEPDIYTFNAFSISGKFVIDYSGNIVSLSDEKYLIDGHPSSGFEITDQNGYKYMFNSVESTTNLLMSSLEETTYNSSWFLSQIITPNGNIVSFTYDNELINYDTPVTMSHIYYVAGYPNCSHLFVGHSSYSNITINSKRLTRIDFPKGYIKFNAFTNRLDLQGAKRLDNIEVYNFNDALIAKHILSFSYFGNSGSSDQDDKRLKLVSISKVAGTETSDHAFGYNDSSNVPSIQSFAKDYWGYYNGKNVNNSPVPNLINAIYTAKNPYTQTPISRYINDDNRTNASLIPSENHAKVGILTTITYPTGGKTVFDYELNDFNYRKSSYASSGVNGGTPTYINLAKAVAATEPFLSDPGYDNSNYGGTVLGDNLERNVSFVAPETGQYAILYVLEGQGNSTASRVQVLEDDYTVLFSVQNGNYSSSNYSQTVFLNENETYILKAQVDDDHRRSVIVISRVDYSGNTKIDENGNTVVSKPTIGGLRVKRIQKYDDNDVLVLQREYEYLMEDNQTSSGVVLNSDLPFISALGNGVNCSEPIKISSNPLHAYGTTKGNLVGYRRVTEKFVDFEHNSSYKNVYEYTSAFDFPDDDVEFFNSDYDISFPLTNRLDNDFRRGLLLSKTSYDTNGDVVNKLVNSYDYAIDELPSKVLGAHFALNSDVSETEVASLGGTPFLLFVNYNKYMYENIYTANLASSKNTLYFDEGQFFEEQTFYSYNRPHSGLVSRVIKSNSNSENLITEMIYPDDIATASMLSDNTTIEGGALTTEAFNAVKKLKHPDNDLAGLHRIGTLVQTNTYNDANDNGIAESSEFLGLKRTNYKDYGNDIVLPKDEESLKGIFNSSTNKLQSRITFHDYDDNGNPLEVSMPGGPRTSYIWGYDQQYPVAKIENATRTQVESTLGVSPGYHTGSGGLNLTQGNTLRNGLPDSMVTTYTYDPLVGVTSVTDPKGNVTYYGYDAYKRLEFVKDADGYLVQEYKYNYKD